MKTYPLLKLGAQEQETKVAPSTKNAQSSSVTEILQRVHSGLFWMGLAVKVKIATEGFAALKSLNSDSKNAFKLSMCKSTVAVYQDIPILKCEG